MAETGMKMLIRGSEGAMGVASALVRMAPGDSVHLFATDKGQNIESIGGMIPQSAKSINGKMSECVVA
jgi:hypothetical protein